MSVDPLTVAPKGLSECLRFRSYRGVIIIVTSRGQRRWIDGDFSHGCHPLPPRRAKGDTMQDCPLRERLIDDWCYALNQLSICVDVMQGYASSPAMFDHQRLIVENARVETDNARRALDEHSSEHRCEHTAEEMANVIPFPTGRTRSVRKMPPSYFNGSWPA